jgi:hypothetical protein
LGFLGLDARGECPRPAVAAFFGVVAGVGDCGLLWEKGIIPDCELATPLDSSLRSE